MMFVQLFTISCDTSYNFAYLLLQILARIETLVDTADETFAKLKPLLTQDKAFAAEAMKLDKWLTTLMFLKRKDPNRSTRNLVLHAGSLVALLKTTAPKGQVAATAPTSAAAAAVSTPVSE